MSDGNDLTTVLHGEAISHLGIITLISFRKLIPVKQFLYANQLTYKTSKNQIPKAENYNWPKSQAEFMDFMNK